MKATCLAQLGLQGYRLGILPIQRWKFTAELNKTLAWRHLGQSAMERKSCPSPFSKFGKHFLNQETMKHCFIGTETSKPWHAATFCITCKSDSHIRGTDPKTQMAALQISCFGQYGQSSWNGSSARDDSGSGAASAANQSWLSTPEQSIIALKEAKHGRMCELFASAGTLSHQAGVFLGCPALADDSAAERGFVDRGEICSAKFKLGWTRVLWSTVPLAFGAAFRFVDCKFRRGRPGGRRRAAMMARAGSRCIVSRSHVRPFQMSRTAFSLIPNARAMSAGSRSRSLCAI